ncbi:uncharacterized protein LOC133308584 [Gastrolobium bilobum]|uniref:uncharacterized protein LOC133308584 n=1 Tax=Gastrolobium bilobum TaxID=150636 RepID=UPI002AB160C3|nr:uncharacterized protein LOC133308584 [Gastrolobium bilobum]
MLVTAFEESLESYHVSGLQLFYFLFGCRFHVPVSQRWAASGGFAAKHPLPSGQQQQEDVNIMPKQRPQTLDSLFANMKEQRMKVLSRQNNAVHHNGGGSRRSPWGRGQFGN